MCFHLLGNTAHAPVNSRIFNSQTIWIEVTTFCIRLGNNGRASHTAQQRLLAALQGIDKIKTV